MLVHPETNYLVILEKDHQCFSTEERKELRETIAKKTNDPSYLEQDDQKIGYPRAGPNKFASCIRIVDPYRLKTLYLEEFQNNEVVFSHFISTTLGGKQSNDTFLILGTGLDVKFSPRSCALGFIKTYRFIENGTKLELIHSTPCEDIPLAFGEYRGRLIAGVGNILRVYELGLKKLLRKVENKNFQAPIINI
jgi:splicing factor 3B subunit 3